jgi:hypothetical protein
MGLIHPSDKAIDLFNQRWTRGSARWKLHETGIEVLTGKSSTTGKMAETRDGEATVLVLSGRLLIQLHPCWFPSSHDKPRWRMLSRLSRPRRALSIGKMSLPKRKEPFLKAHRFGYRTRCVPRPGFDIPTPCVAALYQALCTITRFSKDY